MPLRYDFQKIACDIAIDLPDIAEKKPCKLAKRTDLSKYLNALRFQNAIRAVPGRFALRQSTLTNWVFAGLDR